MKNLSLEEFKSRVLGLTSSRQHKVTGSIGVYNIYKLLRKDRWKNIGTTITEHQFYTIIRTVNNFYAEELKKGNGVKIPSRLGILEIRKYKTKTELKEGKIKTTMPIDWDKTLKLWYEDKESFNKKTLVRLLEQEVFKIYYNKTKALFNNKSFIEFMPNRTIKRELKNNIKKGLIDAYELGRTTT